MQTSPAAQRVVGLGLGAVVLGLLVVLAVALPKAQGATGAVDLPRTLPGGWLATDALEADDFPEGLQADPDTVIASQVASRAFAEESYDGVYEDPTAYRVYTSEDFQALAVVTVFGAGGGSFGATETIVDPESNGLDRGTVELVRHDDAVCVVTYQAAPAGQDAGDPSGVACQQPAGERTVQLTTQGVALDEVYELLADVADEVA